MPQIEILSEQEHGPGWRFAIQVLDDRGGLHTHTLTLSWADYNLWSSDGADEPSSVAEAVMAFLIDRAPVTELGTKFDASLARRRSPDADTVIPSLIRR